MNGLPQQNAIHMERDSATETLILTQKGEDGKTSKIEVRAENIPNFISALSKERSPRKKRPYASRKTPEVSVEKTGFSIGKSA